MKKFRGPEAEVPPFAQPTVDRYRGKFRLGAEISDGQICAVLSHLGKQSTSDEENEKAFAEVIGKGAFVPPPADEVSGE